MSRKRNSDDSVISVVDKNTDLMCDYGDFDSTGLETDNIINIVVSHGIGQLYSGISCCFFEND